MKNSLKLSFIAGLFLAACIYTNRNAFADTPAGFITPKAFSFSGTVDPAKSPASQKIIKEIIASVDLGLPTTGPIGMFLKDRIANMIQVKSIDIQASSNNMQTVALVMTIHFSVLATTRSHTIKKQIPLTAAMKAQIHTKLSETVEAMLNDPTTQKQIIADGKAALQSQQAEIKKEAEKAASQAIPAAVTDTAQKLFKGFFGK